jgi:hypothetical protein
MGWLLLIILIVSGGNSTIEVKEFDNYEDCSKSITELSIKENTKGFLIAECASIEDLEEHKINK